MLRWLGNVLLCASILIAGGWIWHNYTGEISPEYAERNAVHAIIPAGFILWIGFALRYIFARLERR
jgi:TRAP-type C4-dicarboxylate transport system permease small subunit